jgi:hypothetical protein
MGLTHETVERVATGVGPIRYAPGIWWFRQTPVIQGVKRHIVLRRW